MSLNRFPLLTTSILIPGLLCCSDEPEPFDCLEPAQIQIEDGIATLERLYGDCQTQYESWTETLARNPSEDDTDRLLDEVRHRELQDLAIWNQVSSVLTMSTNDLPESARASAFQHAVERLQGPEQGCRKARQEFSTALAQDSELCDTFMQWEARHQSEWEDYDMARAVYQQDCGPMCPGLFVSYGHQLVPRPEGKTTRFSCRALALIQKASMLLTRTPGPVIAIGTDWLFIPTWQSNVTDVITST